MKIKLVKINNFGLYQGENIFDFTLQVDPVVIVKGKNGVGKTTLAESISLTLFGPLSLGERISDVQYKQYLSSRCHKSTKLQLESTYIEVHFDYFKSGVATEYVVRRLWNEKGAERLDIFENGKPVTLEEKEKAFYLKDLVPIGYNRIMFFDGEKIMSLSNDLFINEFIRDCCESLLGLNLVYTLQRDLDTYIKRLLSDSNNNKLTSDLATAQKELENRKKLKEEVLSQIELSHSKVKLLHETIEELQFKVNEKGRLVTDKISGLESRIKELELEVAEEKSKLVEIFNSIGPFSIVKDLVEVLRRRLLDEGKILKERAALDVLNLKVALLELNWESFTTSLSSNEKSQLLEQIKHTLTGEDSSVSDFIPKHDLSETDRNKLIHLCEEAIYERSLIKSITTKLEAKEDKLKELISQKSTYSEESEVKPWLDQIQTLTYQLGAIDNEINSLSRKSKELESNIDFYQQRILSIYKKLQESDISDSKLKMASNTNLVLEAYARNLLSSKLNRLARETVKKFNQLSRKSEVVDKLEIDPNSFNITLYKENKILNHKLLSAGEKQILLLAILWAFHSITNVSVPLIIDTPLARLDIEHRDKVLNTLLPNVSNQVLVIGTEVELSDLADHEISDHIYKVYELEFNEEERKTSIKELETPEYKREEIAC